MGTRERECRAGEVVGAIGFGDVDHFRRKDRERTWIDDANDRAAFEGGSEFPHPDRAAAHNDDEFTGQVQQNGEQGAALYPAAAGASLDGSAGASAVPSASALRYSSRFL